MHLNHGHEPLTMYHTPGTAFVGTGTRQDVDGNLLDWDPDHPPVLHLSGVGDYPATVAADNHKVALWAESDAVTALWPATEIPASVDVSAGGMTIIIAGGLSTHQSRTRGVPRCQTLFGATVHVTMSPIPGPPGPPTVISIGSVTTAGAGSPAAAEMVGDAPNQTLNLTLPKGDKGDKGDRGSVGPSAAAIQTVTLTGPYDLAVPPGAPVDQALGYILAQDATGGRGVTFAGRVVPVKANPLAETMVVLIPIGGTWWAKVVDGVGKSGIPSGAYDDAVAAIGNIRGYYPLDDAAAATTARNLGTSGTPLTRMGSAAFGVAGIGDGSTAAETGAANGYWTTSADKPLAAAGVGTFAALIQLGSPASNRGIYNAGLRVSISGSGIVTLACNGVTTTSASPLLAGVRYHLACVVDGTAHRIYINGSQDASTASTIVIAGNSQNNTVGLDGSNFANRVVLAGVVVTPHALTAAQVASLSSAAGL